MSPKMGQKLTDNPKNITIRARVDKETVEKLDYLVEKYNSSRSEVIRHGIEIQYKKEKE